MIGEVVARLREACPSLKAVRGAAGLALLKPGEDRAAVPAAYVHPHSDRAGPNQLLTGVDQPVERRIGVLLSLAATDETRGGSAVPTLEALVDELRQALAGWQPEGATAPLLLDGGSLRLAESGVIWWLDVFTTVQHLRRV